jgi:hypothetical protein
VLFPIPKEREREREKERTKWNIVFVCLLISKCSFALFTLHFISSPITPPSTGPTPTGHTHCQPSPHKHSSFLSTHAQTCSFLFNPLSFSHTLSHSLGHFVQLAGTPTDTPHPHLKSIFVYLPIHSDWQHGRILFPLSSAAVEMQITAVTQKFRRRSLIRFVDDKPVNIFVRLRNRLAGKALLRLLIWWRRILHNHVDVYLFIKHLCFWRLFWKTSTQYVRTYIHRFLLIFKSDNRKFLGFHLLPNNPLKSVFCLLKWAVPFLLGRGTRKCFFPPQTAKKWLWLANV